MIFSKNDNQLSKTILYFSISTCFLSMNLMAGPDVQSITAPKVSSAQEYSFHAGALITNVAPSVLSANTKSKSAKKDVEIHAEDMLQRGDVLTGIYVGSKFYAIRSSEEHYTTLQNLEENGITKGSIYYVFRRNGAEKKLRVKIEKVGANNFDGLSSSNFTVENALQKVQELIYSRKPKEVSDEPDVVRNIFGLFLKSVQDSMVYNFDALFYAQDYKLADDVTINFASKIDTVLALVEEKINVSNVNVLLGYLETKEISKKEHPKENEKASVTTLVQIYQDLVKTYNGLVKVESEKINPLIAPSFESIDSALSTFSTLGAKIVGLREKMNRKSEPLYYMYRDAVDIEKIITIDQAFLKLSVIVKSLDILKKKVDVSRLNQAYQSERDAMVKLLNAQTQNDVVFLKDLKGHFDSMRQSSLYGYCHTTLRPTGFLVRSLTPGTLAQQLDLRLNDIVKSVTVTSVRNKRQTLFLAGDILSKFFADKAQGLFKKGDQVSAEVMRLSSKKEAGTEKVNIVPLNLTDDIPISKVGVDFYNWSENLCAIVHSGVTRFASQQRIGFETPQDYMNKRFSEIVSVLLDCLKQTETQDFSKLAQSNCNISKWNWNNGKIHVMANLLNILDALETVLMPPRVNSASLESGQIPSPIFVDVDVQAGLYKLLNKDVHTAVDKKFIRLDELKEFLIANWGAVSKILNNAQDFDRVKVDKDSMRTFRQSMVKLIAVHKIYSVLQKDKSAHKDMPSEFDLYRGLDKILSTFPAQDLSGKQKVKRDAHEIVKKDQIGATSEKVVEKDDQSLGDKASNSSKPDNAGKKSVVQNENKLVKKLNDESLKNNNSAAEENLKTKKKEVVVEKQEKYKTVPVETSSDDSFLPPFTDYSFPNELSTSEASEMNDLRKMKDDLNNQADKLLGG